MLQSAVVLTVVTARCLVSNRTYARPRDGTCSQTIYQARVMILYILYKTVWITVQLFIYTMILYKTGLLYSIYDTP